MKIPDQKWIDRTLWAFVIALLLLALAPRCSIQIEFKSTDHSAGEKP